MIINNGLIAQEIRSAVPSVYAPSAHESRSSRYLPIDGDILVRIEGDYFFTYQRVEGEFERTVTVHVAHPTRLQAWLDGWQVEMVKSTQDVIGHALCGFYREAGK